MTRFVDFEFSREIPGFPCISSPRWSSDLITVDSGFERVNQRWEHPLHKYTLPEAIRNHETFEEIKRIWYAMRGPVYTFPFRDPLDFASVDLQTADTVPTISRTDQVIGTGDGVTQTFQLTKAYTKGTQTYTRNIYHPVVSTVLIGYDGADPENISPSFDWDVDRNTGIVTFVEAPEPGVTITAGYLYDVEVRFEDDESFEGIVQTYSVSGFANIVLVEIRPCD